VNAKPKREPSKFPQQSITLKSMDTVLHHVELLLLHGHQVAIIADGDGWSVSTTQRTGHANNG